MLQKYIFFLISLGGKLGHLCEIFFLFLDAGLYHYKFLA